MNKTTIQQRAEEIVIELLDAGASLSADEFTFNRKTADILSLIADTLDEAAGEKRTSFMGLTKSELDRHLGANALRSAIHQLAEEIRYG